MANPTPPREGAGDVVDRIRRIETEVKRLKAPTGTQRVGAVTQLEATVSYLASLQTLGSAPVSAFTTPTIPNDATTYWYATSPDCRIEDIDIPTGQCLIEASVGEASLTPGGNFVIGYVGYSLRDANDVAIPGAGLGNKTGRLYTDRRLGLSISTGSQLVQIDQEAHPGPYLARGFVGMWAAAANTTPVSGVFQGLALRVQVIGEGVFA